MLRYLKETGIGVGVFVLVMIGELLVTLPLGAGGSEPVSDPGRRWSALLVEFGLAAIPALVITLLLARFVRSTLPGLTRGLVWAAVTALLYLVIALGNDNLVMFSVPTFYVLLAALVIGALLGERWVRRTSAAPGVRVRG